MLSITAKRPSARPVHPGIVRAIHVMLTLGIIDHIVRKKEITELALPNLFYKPALCFMTPFSQLKLILSRERHRTMSQQFWHPENDLAVTNTFFLSHKDTSQKMWLLVQLPQDCERGQFSPFWKVACHYYVLKSNQVNHFIGHSLLRFVVCVVCVGVVICKFTYGSHFTKLAFKCISQILLNLK